MIDIKKYKVNNYDCFDICTDEGIFQIWFCGNLDLYWSYMYDGSILDVPNNISFYITKENYFLYNLFDELYNDVKDYNIFSMDMFENRDKWLESKNDFLEHDRYNSKKLFINNRIECHSDDDDYNDGSYFVIERIDDCYRLTFNKSKCDDFIYSITYSVRLRNSGSRYGYFNVVFMRMYNKLREYDPEFHQIHVEEYMYKKNLVKRKKTI